MRKAFTGLSLLAALVLASVAEAGSGLLFHVATANMTLSVNTTIPNHVYPNAGIKINTPGYALSAGCKPSANGYCLFSTSNVIPATLSMTGAAGGVSFTLCLNGLGPLSCQRYTATVTAPATPIVPMHDVAFVTNGAGNNVSSCPVNTDGSLGTCELFTGNSTFNQPVFITFNTAKNFAYIANYNSDSVSVCQVNSTGVLGACTLSAGNGTFASPSGVAINAAGTFAYVANNFNNTVSLCPMVGNGLFGTCTTSSGNLTFSTPQAVTLHATGNPAVTYLYVPNGDGSVSICPVNSDGSLGVCIISNGNGTFLSPKGVSFNAAGTFAYIPSRATNAVSICPLNSDGTFGVCTTTTGNGTFNFTATAVTGLFMSGTSNFGYIPNDSTSLVSICPISTADGTLGTCVSTDGNSTFDLSSSIYISSFAVS